MLQNLGSSKQENIASNFENSRRIKQHGTEVLRKTVDE